MSPLGALIDVKGLKAAADAIGQLSVKEAYDADRVALVAVAAYLKAALEAEEARAKGAGYGD